MSFPRAYRPFAAAGIAALSYYSYSNLGTKPLFSVHADGGLSPKEFQKIKLVKKEPYNHDCSVYTFQVPGQGKLPVASYILTKVPGAGADGKDVVRPYTPITAKSHDEIRLLIKEYPKGNMSRHIASLKPGESLEIKGPMEKFPYKANSKKEIGMLAGGTGITPMHQILDEILNNPEDKTKVTLVFSNHTEKDILLKERLDALAATHENFHVYYALSHPEGGWRGHKGRVDKDLISRLMPKPDLGNDALIMVCGPTGFYDTISGQKAKDFTQGELSGALKDLGYKKEQVLKL